MTRPARIVRAIPADEMDAPRATVPAGPAAHVPPDEYRESDTRDVSSATGADAADDIADTGTAGAPSNESSFAAATSATTAPPTRQPARADKGALIRELKELAGSRPSAEGQRLLQHVTRPAHAPASEQASKEPEPSNTALISELVDLARNGGRREAERVQEEITLQMERFRDKYRDMPGHE